MLGFFMQKCTTLSHTFFYIKITCIRMDYVYTIDPNVAEPIMLINKHIGYDEEDGMGIDGAIFQKELLTLDNMGKKSIQVWMSSPGGNVIDGQNIYNAILKSKTKVDTYAIGVCASIAAVIFQAGRTRTMCDYSALMYHGAQGAKGKELDTINNSIATIISKKTSKNINDVLAMMKKTEWISPSVAKENGFCDDVEDSGELNKKHGNVITAYWKNGSMILNSIKNENQKPKQNKMIKVTNKLGLNEDASEDAILSAITSIENKSAKLQSSLEEMRNSYKEKKQEYENILSELNDMKKKAEDAELEMKKVKITNMVEDFAKLGKIKNESVSKWVAMAEKDFDSTKELLEDLSVSKVSNKIEINKDQNNTQDDFVKKEMFEINRTKNKL